MGIVDFPIRGKAPPQYRATLVGECGGPSRRSFACVSGRRDFRVEALLKSYSSGQPGFSQPLLRQSSAAASAIGQYSRMNARSTSGRKACSPSMLRLASSIRPRCACAAASIAHRDHWMFGSRSDRSAASIASSSRPRKRHASALRTRNCPKYGSCGLRRIAKSMCGSESCGCPLGQAPYQGRSGPGQSLDQSRLLCEAQHRRSVPAHQR